MKLQPCTIFTDDSHRLSELSNDSTRISTDSDSLSYSGGSYDLEENELCPIDDFPSSPSSTSLSEEENDSKVLTSPLRYLKPLYQFYSRDADAAARKEITHLVSKDTDDEVTEQIPFLTKNKNRIYWKDTPEVQASGYLETLTDLEKKKQEAKFEILISEASYKQSLNVLEKHYMKHLRYLVKNPEKNCLRRERKDSNSEKPNPEKQLTEKDYKSLFGNIAEVRKSSENFFNDLKKHWGDDILLTDIYDIIKNHATDSFRTYIHYSKHFLNMTKKYEELVSANPELKLMLDLLCKHQTAKNLPLDSFLALPIQRITRFPLLMKNVLQYTDRDSKEFQSGMLILRMLKNVSRKYTGTCLENHCGS